MSFVQIIWWCFTVPVISFVLGSVSTKALSRWMTDEMQADAERWRCLSYLFFISDELALQIEDGEDPFSQQITLSCDPADNYAGFSFTSSHDPEDVLDQVMEHISWRSRATDDEARSV